MNKWPKSIGTGIGVTTAVYMMDWYKVRQKMSLLT